MESAKSILLVNQIKSMLIIRANVEVDSSIFQEAVLNVKIITISMELHALLVQMEQWLLMEHHVLVIMGSLIFLENVKDVEQMKYTVILHKLAIVQLDTIGLVEHVKDLQQI